MGSITLSALFLLLVFVSPSLMILTVFRFFYPKTRTMKVPEGIVLLGSCIVNLFVNISLLDYYVKIVFQQIGLEFVEDGYRQLISTVFLGPEPTSRPYRPMFELVSSIGFEGIATNSSSFWIFVLDLHIRAMLFGVGFFFVVKIIANIEEYMQASVYNKGFLSLPGRFLVRLFCGKIDSDEDKKLYGHKKIAFTFFGWEPVTWFREAVYHPWSMITWTNKQREIKMVDVLTSDGSLYSGAFRSWVPESDTISEVALEYVLRFLPKKNPKDVREMRLIGNNGDMVIPRERIETIHFWEIRKNFEVTIVVSKHQDIERAKWFYLLACSSPGIITKMNLVIELSDVNWAKFRKDFLKWRQQSKLKLQDSNIEFIRVKNSSAAQNQPKKPRKPKTP